jgi:hypothetical protein
MILKVFIQSPKAGLPRSAATEASSHLNFVDKLAIEYRSLYSTESTNNVGCTTESSCNMVPTNISLDYISSKITVIHVKFHVYVKMSLNFCDV